MSQIIPPLAVDYPSSDGQPMGESDVHIDCIIYVRGALRRYFGKQGRDEVYVAGNMFLYYEQGNPRAVVAPDVFMVRGAPVHQRDSYLLWNEPKGPDFVLEVTSASTRREDEGRKRGLYASLGVQEYFLYDPRGEYLAPPLKGYRLRDGEYRALPALPVLPGRGVAVRSEVLGLELRARREERRLRLRDTAEGRDLPTYEEVDRALEEMVAARQHESAARQQETDARRAAEARAAELEARLRDLEQTSASPKGPHRRSPAR